MNPKAWGGGLNFKIDWQNAILMGIPFFIAQLLGVVLGALPLASASTPNALPVLHPGMLLSVIALPWVATGLANQRWGIGPVLAGVHAVGTLLLFYMAFAGGATQPLWALSLYAGLTLSSLGLSQAWVLQRSKRASVEFPLARLWGSLGAFLAVIVTLLLFQAAQPTVFSYAPLLKWAGGLSAGMVVLSLWLPAPSVKLESDRLNWRILVGWDTVKWLTGKSLGRFYLAGMLISIPLVFGAHASWRFFAESGMPGWSPLFYGCFALGEIAALVGLEFLLARLGLKKTMLAGMVAGAVGLGGFVVGAAVMGIGMGIGMGVGMALGMFGLGAGWTLSLVPGQIRIDSLTRDSLRIAGQTVWVQWTGGLGMMVGLWVSQSVLKVYESQGGHQWSVLWYVPLAMCVLVTIGFGFLFKDDDPDSKPDSTPG
jgi:Nucleoside H+ symporter